MITKRQKEILNHVENFVEENGYSPTLEEIKDHFGLSSVATVHQHIENLRTKGYLTKLDNHPRSIEINTQEKDINLVDIVISGTIAAGEPILAVEDKEIIKIHKSQLPKKGNYFALRVAGNSMIEDGIFNGDIVIVREQSVAQNGDTIVAIINDGEATLKRFYREKNKFRLQPANSKMKPVFTKELIIQGKVINVLRKFEETDVKKMSIKELTLKKETYRRKQSIEKHLNKVFLGDIMDLLKKLPDKSVNMIFGDPDYNVGIKYGNKTYTKDFNKYIDWYIKLTKESMRVLKNDGNLFMMNYPKQNAHLRVKYLDKVYPLTKEYVWVYNTNVGHSPRRFTTAHRTILHVRKTKNNRFYKNNVALPYKNLTDKRILENIKNGSKGRMPYSWSYFNLVKNVSKEKTHHACQIPQKLTGMLIKSCTQKDDIVLVLFGGSGAEIEMCKLLKRQFISAEIDKNYHEMILDRLENGYIKKKYKPQTRKNKKNNYLQQSPLFKKIDAQLVK